MARVVVVGSANTDLVCLVDRLPGPGETVIGGRFVEAAGGKGANQAVAAARLGSNVVLIARLGTDAYGDAAIDGCLAEGIDTSRITRNSELPSGVALILVDASGENSIAVASGANAALAPEHIEAAADAFPNADVVLIQLEIPLDAVMAAARLGAGAGATVILNPAPAPAGPLPAELLADIGILTPNETEAAQLSGVLVGRYDQQAAALRELGIDTVVVTLGKQGAFFDSGDDRGQIPVREVRAVDTTAAGDAFNGALATFLGEGVPLPQAVARANHAGALAATRTGAQPSLPGRDEWRDFFRPGG